MDTHDLLEDKITLKIGNSNKQKKATINVHQNRNMIELHIMLKTVVSGRSYISTEKTAIFNFQESNEELTVSLKKQIGSSCSHIEVYIP